MDEGGGRGRRGRVFESTTQYCLLYDVAISEDLGDPGGFIASRGRMDGRVRARRLGLSRRAWPRFSKDDVEEWGREWEWENDDAGAFYSTETALSTSLART